MKQILQAKVGAFKLRLICAKVSKLLFRFRIDQRFHVFFRKLQTFGKMEKTSLFTDNFSRIFLGVFINAFALIFR